MIRFFTKSIFLLVAIIFVFSCKKEKKKNDNISATSSDVLILNEGNFMWGNAEYDLFKPNDSSLTAGVYKKNNNAALGDVLQSAFQIKSNLYFVLNNSGKITIVDAKTNKFVSNITEFKSPRYLLPYSDSMALVTDLYDANVYIVNIISNTIKTKIKVNGHCEMMHKIGNYTYICNAAGGQLYVFNNQLEKITDSIKLEVGAQWICADNSNNLWVLCSKDNKSNLIQIDPINKSIKRNISISGAASRLTFNKAKNELYFINGNIKVLDANNSASAPTEYFSKLGANFYGLNYDNNSNLLYVSDAADYVSKSNIYALSAADKIRFQFKSGIISTDFLFIK